MTPPEGSPQREEALIHLIHQFKATARRSTMTAQKPRLFVSPLTGNVYCATKYREGNCGGAFVADVKHNVTEDFDRIAAERAAAKDAEA